MYKATLIGLGNIAWKYDARKPDSSFALTQGGAFLNEKGISLIGGCSPDAIDRKQFTEWLKNGYVFDNPAEMINKLQPDIVGICSPTPFHFEHAMQCLEMGIKIIWLEKPPTLNLRELKILTCHAKKMNATVCVNYFRRYMPQYQYLKELIHSKRYGKIINIRITYSPGLARNGVHLLDQIFFLTGSSNYKLLWVENDGDPECPSFAIRISNGVLVLGCGGKVPYHTNDISVQLPKATVSIFNGGKIAVEYLASENELFPEFFDLQYCDNGLQKLAGLNNYMQNSLKDLLFAAKNSVMPKSNLITSLLAQRLLEEILEKSK